ncbi:MAG: hypothetical protein II998_02685 [Clostridia bacterium]|nr:hypothetical protein [Clostridia bacterium]
MICPNCNTDSKGSKWCVKCGIRLELDDISIDGAFEQNESNNFNHEDNELSYPGNFGANNYANSGANNYANSGANNYANGGANNATQGGYGRYSEHGPDDYDDGYNEYDEYESDNSNKKLKIAVAIIAPITVIILAFVILVITGVIDFGSSDAKPDKAPASQQSSDKALEEEEITTLMNKGENYMNMGDYEAAESVYKTVVDKDSSNTEASTIYQILYNYNRAVKKLESKKYVDARSLFEKIPNSYINYSISDDVERLDDEIVAFESTNAMFDNLRDYMNYGDYYKAEEIIDLIDEQYLTDSDIKILDRYRVQIEEEMSNDSFTEVEAEILMNNYCNAYVRSINENDFSYVSQYLRGDLYDEQKRMVKYWNDQRAAQSFNYVTVDSFRKVSSNKWEIGVTESETVYLPDGSSDIYTGKWIYTVEYIGSDYYLTHIVDND